MTIFIFGGLPKEALFICTFFALLSALAYGAVRFAIWMDEHWN